MNIEKTNEMLSTQETESTHVKKEIKISDFFVGDLLNITVDAIEVNTGKSIPRNIINLLLKCSECYYAENLYPVQRLLNDVPDIDYIEFDFNFKNGCGVSYAKLHVDLLLEKEFFKEAIERFIVSRKNHIKNVETRLQRTIAEAEKSANEEIGNINKRLDLLEQHFNEIGCNLNDYIVGN